MDNKNFQETIEKIKAWIKVNIPSFIIALTEAVFGRINKLKNEVAEKDLEIQKRIASDKIKNDANALGDDAIIDDAIAKGRGSSTDQ